MIYDPVSGGTPGDGTWPGVFYDNDVGEEYFPVVDALCTDSSDYHIRFENYQLVDWLFCGGDFPISPSSELGIFADYNRYADSGPGDTTFCSRISKN